MNPVEQHLHILRTDRRRWPRTGIRVHRGRVRAFLRAVTGPKVDDEAFDARLAACRTCPFRVEKKGREYCGACGCPKWRYARLQRKLRYARLSCPLDPPRWDEVEVSL